LRHLNTTSKNISAITNILTSPCNTIFETCFSRSTKVSSYWFNWFNYRLVLLLFIKHYKNFFAKKFLNFFLSSGEILKELKTNEGHLTKHFECKKENHNKVWSPPLTTGYDGSVNSGVDYKFQDPETYTGPVVQGWEPGKLKKNQIQTCFEQNKTCSEPVQTCFA